jgi:hypothetical protein
MQKSQGYTSAMLVQDSRTLQVTLFGTLQKNLGALDFSLLLPDVTTIADEVNSQLTQAMEGYTGVMATKAAASPKVQKELSFYVSLSDLRCTNGHAQSGGHWNVALRMMARGSGNFGSPQWSSRSGDGSTNGILCITGIVLRQRSAASLRCATNRKMRSMGDGAASVSFTCS